MACDCPVCHCSQSRLRIMILPLWGQWRCRDCGSLLGVDRKRRLLAIAALPVALLGLIVALRGTSFGMAWTLLVVSVVTMLTIWISAHARVLERVGFRCRHCGYDLAGQRDPACPECGRAVDEADLPRFARLVLGERDLEVERLAGPNERRMGVLVAILVILASMLIAAGFIVFRINRAAPPAPAAPAPAAAPPAAP